IEIGDRAAETRSSCRQPGLGRHIGKLTVPVIPQKQVTDPALLHDSSDQKQIELSVAIKVEYDHCAAKALLNAFSQLAHGAGLKIGLSCPVRPSGKVDLQFVILQE